MPVQSNLPIIKQALNHLRRTAIIDENGTYSYKELLSAAERVAIRLLGDRADLQEARVAFMIPSGFDYVAVQWGIWLAGGIAVPLCISHPLPELEYVVGDSKADILALHPQYEEKLQPLVEEQGLRVISTSDVTPAGHEVQPENKFPEIRENRRGMILYTSGTTSKPKGVVLTHRNITSQITTLIEAWEWSANDRILHVLPLHHTHGIINALLCALWAGASCKMLPQFDAATVWNRFLESDLTLFMAVPTVYIKLIAEWENSPPDKQNQMSQACSRMRLMVSGSAALPVSTFEKWKDITGHTLLERYGMTEIGMAISNPLHGERRPGYIGRPLPGVPIRLVDESGNEIIDKGISGEIWVKGSNVFLEYWERPEATREVFKQGWFRTGDMAVIENGYFRILGRSSVDIIKTGGYKVSALEIEDMLRLHADIKECAVVGKEDFEWGERVCAAVTVNNDASLSLEELRQWARVRMATYKIPSRLLVLDELPRNAMGKVTKPEVKKLFG